MRIIIETIKHEAQRYPTVGDWYFNADQSELTIKVSELGDWRKEACIAVHELFEVLLCKHQGVSQEEVDKFDMKYEEDRPEGNLDEPGDDPNAPYRKQHCLATAVERMLAAELDLSWTEYEEVIESLP